MTSERHSGRAYERTHPWLTFAMDFRRLRPSDWLALGECAALCERISGAPLDPDVAERLHTMYLAKGALATTAIEGNTLSEEEARNRIEGRLDLPPSQEYLGREIDNIVEAVNGLTDDIVANGRLSLSVASVERMNGMVLRNLEADDHVVPGRTRRADVSVGSYRCPGWQDAEYLLARFCGFIAAFEAPTGNRLALAILKAVAAHVYMAWIHPFGDGNGRTARLVEWAILMEAGMPQPACHLLSNYYNRTRTEYYRQLARASRADNGIFGFVSYAIEGLNEELRGQVREIREHQWEVAWVNFVHEQFRSIRSVTARRRRSLALDLSRARDWVGLRDLPGIMSVELRLEYAGVTGRTLMRDVQALESLGILARGRSGVRANRERILAFLPWRNEPEGGDKA